MADPKRPEERATSDLRQVMSGGATLTGAPVCVGVQRRWLVPAGPAYYGFCEGAEDVPAWGSDPETKNLLWWPMASEWRDLPRVTAQQVAAEKAERGGIISTDA